MRSRQRRVLNHAAAVDRDRRPRHRNRKPRTPPAARKPTCSAAGPAPWRRWDPEGQGARPPPPAVTLKRSRKSASRQAVKNPERTHATEISPTRKNPEIECAHE